jgi:hypothetical protein
VFGPLRGVFERLGASVLYQDGTINAQGNGRTVLLSLHRSVLVTGIVFTA